MIISSENEVTFNIVKNFFLKINDDANESRVNIGLIISSWQGHETCEFDTN